MMANISTPIPALKLNDGTSMPMLGYGTGTAWYVLPIFPHQIATACGTACRL